MCNWNKIKVPLPYPGIGSNETDSHPIPENRPTEVWTSSKYILGTI